MQSMKREIVLALNLIFGLTLLGWPFMAIFSLDLFEASAAPHGIPAIVMLVLIWAYPMTYIGALAWSRAALVSSRSRRHAVRIALLPAANLALVLGVTVLVWTQCGHGFTC